MLYKSLFVASSLLLAALFVHRTLNQRRSRWVLFLSIPLLIFVFMPLASVATTFQVLVLLLLIALSRFRTMSSNQFLAMSFAMTVAVFATVEIYDEWRLRTLRQEYPVESMGARLAYEKVGAKVGNPTLTQDARSRLAYLEEKFSKGNLFRDLPLSELHDNTVHSFVNSEGFGVGRRIPSLRSLSYYRKPQLFPKAVIPSLESKSASDEDPSLLIATSVAREREIERNHEIAILLFADSKLYGHIEDREHVIGFLPHGFIASIENFGDNATDDWRAVNIELVSILKHDPPGVYITDHLPNMEELRDASVRSLDDFEAQGLEMLRQGEDIVVKESPRQMRMLGSIRAAKQCLACHTVERGALLGAFSYDLRSDAKATQKGDAKSPDSKTPALYITLAAVVINGKRDWLRVAPTLSQSGGVTHDRRR